MSGNITASRIGQLRSLMESEGVHMYMIPDSDYHNSEYVGDYFKCREYMSGFTGSNGLLIVSSDEAALWTDGRYFIQAAHELEGSGITLMRMGEPGVMRIDEFIKKHTGRGQVFGVDGRVINAGDGIRYERIMDENGGKMRADLDLVSRIWNDRPPMSRHSVMLLDDEVSGESISSKLERIREKIKENACSSYMLSALDDICWLTNMRGGDIECTPVTLSYMYIDLDNAYLFIQREALDEQTKQCFIHNGITIKDYEDLIGFLDDETPVLKGNVLLDLRNTSYAVYHHLKNVKYLDEHGDEHTVQGYLNDKRDRNDTCAETAHDVPVYSLKDRYNPTEEMEAVRNETQLRLIREYYLRDSAALCGFLFALKRDVESGCRINEYEAALKLDEMRSRIPGFIELSFPTISAYGANAAMMHYEATAGSHSDILPEGMYLVDSGGQYMGATTDVTRTIALGPVSDEMRRDFTLVCVGMLRLADAVFLDGCTGRNLDILARGELWRRGMDYKCGTGHGVGYILGVHTGPQGIRSRYVEGRHETVLKPGMTVSDEPGVYREDRYGIRTENILEIVEKYETPDGHFYGFEHLTWVPIDLTLIDTSYMNRRDIELLNTYHEQVYERLSGLMQTDEERAWLKSATRPIGEE